MLNTEVTVIPDKANYLKLITVNLHDLINDNVADLISLLRQNCSNNVKLHIRLIYDINIILNNKKQYKLDFDDTLPYRALYSDFVSSRRDESSIEVWAKRIIKSFYYHLQKSKTRQLNLPSTNENMIKIKQIINDGKILFTPRAYIDWIMPRALQLQHLNDLDAIDEFYIQLDRNYFASQVIKQSNWLSQLSKNKRLQWLVFRVLSVELYEQARPTPNIQALLRQLYKVTSEEHKYEVRNVINTYSMAQ